MPTLSLHKGKTPYDILLSQVRNTLIQGQQRVEEEKVRTYWQTGQHINKHILKYSKRAEYGAEIISRLVDDLKLHRSTLHYCVRFARTYKVFPIVHGREQFKWSHFRELIAVPDEKLRKRLESETQRNAWTSDELIARIKAERLGSTEQDEPSQAPQPTAVSRELLKPLRGELFTYRIVERPTLGAPADEPGLLLDLGFGIFRDLEARVISQFKAGDIVTSRNREVTSKPKDDTYKFTTKEGATDKDLFTFQAYVEKILDGDTLKVRFDLGFNTWTRQTLRLRGLDCAEMSTKEGVAAKTFVQSYIKEADQIIVHSTRDDKYGRYLADIYLPTSEGEIYLNNLLLEKGFAGRM